VPYLEIIIPLEKKVHGLSSVAPNIDYALMGFQLACIPVELG